MLPRIQFTEENYAASTARHLRDAMFHQTQKGVYGDDALVAGNHQALVRTKDEQNAVKIINHLIGLRANQTPLQDDLIVCKSIEARNDGVMAAMFETFTSCRINDDVSVFVHKEVVNTWQDDSLKPSDLFDLTVGVLAKDGSYLRYRTCGDGNNSLETQQNVDNNQRPFRGRGAQHRYEGEFAAGIIIWLVQNEQSALLEGVILDDELFKIQLNLVSMIDSLQRSFNKDNRTINIHTRGLAASPVYSLYIHSNPVPYYSQLPEVDVEAAKTNLSSFLTELGVAIEVHPDESTFNDGYDVNGRGKCALWNIKTPDGSYVMSIGYDLRVQVIDAASYAYANKLMHELAPFCSPF